MKIIIISKPYSPNQYLEHTFNTVSKCSDMFLVVRCPEPISKILQISRIVYRRVGEKFCLTQYLKIELKLFKRTEPTQIPLHGHHNQLRNILSLHNISAGLAVSPHIPTAF